MLFHKVWWNFQKGRYICHVNRLSAQLGRVTTLIVQKTNQARLKYRYSIRRIWPWNFKYHYCTTLQMVFEDVDKTTNLGRAFKWKRFQHKVGNLPILTLSFTMLVFEDFYCSQRKTQIMSFHFTTTKSFRKLSWKRGLIYTRCN